MPFCRVGCVVLAMNRARVDQRGAFGIGALVIWAWHHGQDNSESRGSQSNLERLSNLSLTPKRVQDVGKAR